MHILEKRSFLQCLLASYLSSHQLQLQHHKLMSFSSLLCASSQEDFTVKLNKVFHLTDLSQEMLGGASCAFRMMVTLLIMYYFVVSIAFFHRLLSI